jgi:hypothetical protein
MSRIIVTLTVVIVTILFRLLLGRNFSNLRAANPEGFLLHLVWGGLDSMKSAQFPTEFWTRI